MSLRIRIPTGILDLDRRLLVRTGGDIRLTTLENRLLSHLVAHAPDVVCREDLLREVWGYSDGVRTAAVEQAVRRIRVKVELDAKNPTLLMTEHGRGYRWRVPRRDVSPRPTDTMFGRDQELVLLREWLAQGIRIVTITGMGGMGKTRLARELLWQGRDVGLPDGPWFVEVAGVRDAAGIDQALAQSLGASTTSLEGMLGRMGPAWVVLDNAEQVSDALANRLVHWQRLAPEIQWVTTSRERLDLPGERVLALEPLSPEDGVRMWCERAAHQADCHLEEDNPTLIRLAERLDGIPLAIELAASRSHLYSPERLLSQLDWLLEVPARPRRGVVDRQATMLGCLRWSWKLLSDPEQTALVACAVFRGGFDMDSVAEVANLPEIETALAGLIAKSMVRVVSPGRFDLFAVVREFALSRVGARREVHQRRHAQHFAKLGEEEAIRDLARSPTHVRHRLLELENLQSAADIALHEGWTDLVGPLCYTVSVVMIRAKLSVAEERLPKALALPGLPERWHQLLRLLTAGLATFVGDLEKSEAILNDLLSESMDGSLRGRVLLERGVVEYWRSQHQAALGFWIRSRDALLDCGDDWYAGNAIANVGVAVAGLGRLTEAEVLERDAWRLQERCGNIGALPGVWVQLGDLAVGRGDQDAALECLGRALEIHLDFNQPRRQWRNHLETGMVLWERGDPTRGPFDLGVEVAAELDTPEALPKALGTRAWFLSQWGEPVEAMADLARARELGGDPGVYGVRAEASLAVARDGLDYARALLARQLANTKDPLHVVPLWCDLGQIAQKQQNWMAVAHALDKAESAYLNTFLTLAPRVLVPLSALRQVVHRKSDEF